MSRVLEKVGKKGIGRSRRARIVEGGWIGACR